VDGEAEQYEEVGEIIRVGEIMASWGIEIDANEVCLCKGVE